MLWAGLQLRATQRNIARPGVSSRPAFSTPKGETKSVSSRSAALAPIHPQTPLSYGRACRQQRGSSRA